MYGPPRNISRNINPETRRLTFARASRAVVGSPAADAAVFISSASRLKGRRGNRFPALESETHGVFLVFP